MTTQSTDCLLFSSLSSFNLLVLFSDQLLISFPLYKQSYLAFLSSSCLGVILKVWKCGHPGKMSQERGLAAEAKGMAEGCHVQSQSLLQQGQTAGSQALDFIFKHTSERKLPSPFKSRQREPTSHQVWSPSFAKGNSALVELSASGGKPSLSTSSNRSKPWKYIGFNLGIACSKLEYKLHWALCFCIAQLPKTTDIQSDPEEASYTLEGPTKFRSSGEGAEHTGKGLCQLWLASELDMESLPSQVAEKQWIPPPPKVNIWNRSEESCSRNVYS